MKEKQWEAKRAQVQQLRDFECFFFKPQTMKQKRFANLQLFDPNPRTLEKQDIPIEAACWLTDSPTHSTRSRLCRELHAKSQGDGDKGLHSGNELRQSDTSKQEQSPGLGPGGKTHLQAREVTLQGPRRTSKGRWIPIEEARGCQREREEEWQMG